jgi:hypothetical protein
MTGQWLEAEPYPRQLTQIADALGVNRKTLIDSIASTGMLVTKAFYVPDADELLGLMKTVQYHLYRGMQGCRWVMCRETVDVLAAKWASHQTVPPVRFDAAFWQSALQGGELPPAALEMEILTIIEHNRRWTDQSKLFGVPIRIDPAARSPLLEIDTPTTSWRALGEVPHETTS